MSILILIATLILSQSLFAQADSSALSFYPLHNGDYWEYSTTTKDYDGQIIDKAFYSLKVVRDSLLENSKYYKVIVKKSIPDTGAIKHFYERIDSSTANVYRYNSNLSFKNHEYLIDSLKVFKGDTSRASRGSVPFANEIPMTLCTDITTDSIFGKNTTIKHLTQFDFIPGYNYELAQGFGIIRIPNFTETVIVETKLLFTIINGQEFGSPVVVSVNYEKREPIQFQLYQNYPNPFNPSTHISYSVQNPGFITLKIYNLSGQEIMTLVNEFKQVGTYTITFEANEISSGIYFYKCQSGNYFSKTMKMLILK